MNKFLEGMSGFRSQMWKYDNDFTSESGWSDSDSFQDNENNIPGIWQPGLFIRQTIGINLCTNISELKYYKVSRKGKSDSVLATNYQRYVLEIKKKQTINKRDSVLVLLMKNPSTASIVQTDTTAKLVENLFKIKSRQDLSTYNHIIIVNLLPFVTPEVIRLNGYTDDIIGDYSYFEETLNLPIINMNEGSNTNKALFFRKRAINNQEMKKKIKNNLTLMNCQKLLDLNNQFILSILRELNDNKTLYDVLIATGAIEGANNHNLKNKTITLKRAGRTILFDQYLRIMETISDTLMCGNVKNHDDKSSQHLLLSTKILNGKNSCGYAQHPSAHTCKNTPAGILLDNNDIPVPVYWNKEITTSYCGGLKMLGSTYE